MDICAGGDPLEVFCDTLDALVELCEELTQTVINGDYRQDAGCGAWNSIHKSLIILSIIISLVIQAPQL